MEAAFADGSSARYFHDDLGNRSLAEHSDGQHRSSTSTTRRGISTSVETTERGGTRRLETLPSPTGTVARIAVNRAATLGDGYRVFALGRETTLAAHDISAVARRIGTSSEDLHRTSARVSPHVARDVLAGGHALVTQPDYGVVAFGRGLVAYGEDRLRDLRHLEDAADLHGIAGRLARETAIDGLEGQLDVVFWPLERAVTGSGTRTDSADSCADAAFKGLARAVDECIRSASSEAGSITPHEIEFRDLPGWGQAERHVDRYVTVLDIEAIQDHALTSQRSDRDMVHEVLVHEYVHHIYPELSGHGRLFETRMDRLMRETRDCD